MNAPRPLPALRQLIRDTFRQAWASGIFAMMLTVTAVCVVLCLSVSVSGDTTLHGADEPPLFLPPPSPRVIAPSALLALGSSGPLDAAARAATGGQVWFALANNPEMARHEGVDTVGGRMSLAFGAISFPVARERADSVRFLELVLSAGVTGSAGLLLALVWTAGFLPTFLDPRAASVLLAKPVGRSQLLVGKYLGVLIFVGLQVVLFVVLTWLALGLRTNVWDMAYWWCIPLLVVQFAVLYSFSALLAVTTRSTVACVFGSLLFWLTSWGINYGSVMAHGAAEARQASPVTVVLADAAYWISPKPIDAGLILYNALGSEQHFEKPTVFRLLESGRGFSPWLSLLSSLAFAAVLLGFSAYEFVARDY